ncbi:MAG TPA: glycerophosphodiester phosphodiesterase family protein [Allosphingosinicella sp.]|jgi:glycerophosphoryl diester phosphodiesterase
MKVWKPLGLGIAGAAIALSLINASWIAPDPKGPLVLVARRGVGSAILGADEKDCSATRIAPPGENLYIENSLPSIYRAMRLGAGAVEVDVRRTRDNQVVLFRDSTLECRTNGRGAVADQTLEQLKTLDIGFGYTADGGRRFPLRGRGIGGMPTVEEALREVPKMRLIFNFASGDPADADALVAAFARAEMKIDEKYSFRGVPAVTKRIKALVPGAWTWGEPELGGCLDDYVRTGWTSFVPASCRNTTVVVPIDRQWAIWGWPNRFQARMAGANSKVMVVESVAGAEVTGLTQVDHIDDVPRDFRGYLWIEDFFTVGRAVQR